MTDRAVEVPARTDYDPMLGATLHTGADALGVFSGHGPGRYVGGPVAFDNETPGLHDPFTVKCVTAAWNAADGVHAVLLDPTHRDTDRAETRAILGTAEQLVFHNAPFDVPSLVVNGWADRDVVWRAYDTLVIARMCWPDPLTDKSLEGLAVRVLRMNQLKDGLKIAMRAAGVKSKTQWYAEGDIHMPTYRFGAMADTVVTLRVLAPLWDLTVERLTDHPFTDRGLTDPVEASAVIEREQLVNRIMMRRTAAGLAVDREQLDAYREEVETDLVLAEKALRDEGIEPGANAGKDLVKRLAASGELPSAWPRTPGGALSAAKDNLEKLNHPLADAHRRHAEIGKIVGYLEAVAARSRVTGRLHQQVNVLGASATGRMSYVEPPLQQFTGKARPIITDDGQGLTSIDWSQIEPVTMANMACDDEFLAPFEAGADLYEPIMRSAGIDRKLAKVILLGTMYGQGDKAIAAKTGHTLDSALQIKRQMFAAMPECKAFMDRVVTVANTYGIVPAVDGRILSVPQFNGEYTGYKAVNYVCQGSAYSILSDTIVRVHAAGLSDHIQIALHDELVVDTPAAEEVREIMLTPPEFLERWSGRRPVFRTDMAHMDHHWASV